jgi:hypothetical protein
MVMRFDAFVCEVAQEVSVHQSVRRRIYKNNHLIGFIWVKIIEHTTTSITSP